jgi:predicted peptidase
MDGVVPVRGSREAAAALKAASGDVQYTEYLGLNHNSWDATYASDSFVRWLFAQRRHQR